MPTWIQTHTHPAASLPAALSLPSAALLSLFHRHQQHRCPGGRGAPVGAARSPHGVGAPARPRALPLPRWPRAAGRGEASPRRRPSRRHVAPQLRSLRAPPWLRRLPPARCCSACSAWCCPAAARCTPRAPCRSTPSPSTRYGAGGLPERSGGGCGAAPGRVSPRPAAAPGPGRNAGGAAGPRARGRCRRHRRGERSVLAERPRRSQWERGGRSTQPIGTRRLRPAANRRGPSGAEPRGPARRYRRYRGGEVRPRPPLLGRAVLSVPLREGSTVQGWSRGRGRALLGFHLFIKQQQALFFFSLFFPLH